MEKGKKTLLTLEIDEEVLMKQFGSEGANKGVVNLIFEKVDPLIKDGFSVKEIKQIELDDGMAELLDRKVYRLCGEDVVGVLEDMGLGHIVEDKEKLGEIIDYLDRKLEIPWMEYVRCSIECGIDFGGIKVDKNLKDDEDCEEDEE